LFRKLFDRSTRTDAQVGEADLFLDLRNRNRALIRVDCTEFVDEICEKTATDGNRQNREKAAEPREGVKLVMASSRRKWILDSDDGLAKRSSSGKGFGIRTAIIVSQSGRRKEE
jgi:hypothetical protein